MESTTTATSQELVEFIFICSIFLGGPLGIVHSVLEAKLMTWLRTEMIIKACLTSVAAVLCLLMANLTHSSFTLFEIASAVPGVIGGMSLTKSTTAAVTTKVQAMRSGAPDGQSTIAGDPPVGG
jgi:NhaP-type Na+/H+ or K+/H+ antiporter